MRGWFFLLVCLAPPPGRAINAVPSSPATTGVSTSAASGQSQVYAKCYEFKSPPLRIYCILPGSKYIKGFDANLQCFKYNMRMPTTSSTDLSRSCILMKIFALEEGQFFVENRSMEYTEYQLREWSQCNEKTLLEGATRVLKNNTTPDAVAVCEANHYHSNGSSCVAVEEGSNDVVHCYFKEEVSARESSLRCNDLGSDVHTSLLSRKHELSKTTIHMLAEREVWVDRTAENIREMNGLTALNLNDSDWNSSCITVSMLDVMPRFFKRSCSSLYTTICQYKGGLLDLSELNRTGCHRSGHEQNYSMATELCRNRWRIVLGDALDPSALLQLHRYVHPAAYSSCHDLYIWDGSSYQTQTGNICGAIKWYESLRIPHRCSGAFSYTCSRRNPGNLIWPPENENLYCGHLSRGDSRRRMTCLQRMYLNHEESARACAEHGMSVLREGLQMSDYQTVLGEYKTHTYPNEAYSYWLKTRKSDSKQCIALAGYDNQYMPLKMNCSSKLRTVCVAPNAIHTSSGWTG